MSLIKYIKHARKDYKCDKCGGDILKGEQYRKVKPYKRKELRVCMKCKCRPWEFSVSEYIRTVGRIVEDWQEEHVDLECAAEDIESELQELLDDAQEKLDNLTEVHLEEGSSGLLLQERIETMEAAINELQSINYEDVKAEAESDVNDEAEELKEKGEFNDENDEFIEKDMQDWIETNVEERVSEEMTEQIEDALSNLEY